ncbi:E3 SUMO-protein ligase KIAA1586-like [Mercenaria mercenaria]|uniref:E3 SUMO-protein ligase KIAA1586-like n=1 Tax=Mercenaria mercenaria TaxID=6596 RepID=UPI00234F8A28|nr:E3 SUMO-protein ligase KIAA1586-like [Mercenaria mercenaria]
MEMLKVKGISLSNLCGVSTDGAAVMIGHKSGVVTRLKREVPSVLATHCIAHRLALSCCTGTDAIPYMVKVQEVINSVYKYFHYSPKNMAMLEAIQSLTPGQSQRFKEVFHTRWLSFEGSVSAMVTNFSNLISVFLEENLGKALSRHKSLTCFKFLYVVHFLCDVFKPLAILSKMYQKQDLDFTEVTSLLRSTIDCVSDFQVKKNGQTLTEFLDLVPSG